MIEPSKKNKGSLPATVIFASGTCQTIDLLDQEIYITTPRLSTFICHPEGGEGGEAMDAPSK